MLDLIIIYDHLDGQLGVYFEGCKSSLEVFISDKDYFITSHFLDGYSTSQISVDMKVDAMSEGNFIFVAYSHGSTDGNSLLCQSNAYLIKNINTNNFKKGLVYTNACYAGKELGPDLESRGCLAFIGNKEPVEALLGKYEAMSIKIDNYCLFLFLGTNKTIHKCFEDTKSYYNHTIDKIFKIDRNPAVAAILTYNRDALVFYGKEDLTKEQLFN